MLKKYAVVGNPIAHSLSPQIHRLFAAQFNIELSYERILAPLDGFAGILRTFQQSGGLGANITVPFKIAAAQLVHEKTEQATLAGAVNTITFQQNKWLGDNTDGIGLLRDLTQNLGIDLTDRKILILGAGGAAQGILQPLFSANPASITLANRTLATAEKLAAALQYSSKCMACDLKNLPQQAFDLIINATAAGVKDEPLALPTFLIKQQTVCYDLAYGAAAQPFLTWATQHGALMRYDGSGMLIEQAAEAFYSWHGVRPETQSLISLLNSKIHL